MQNFVGFPVIRLFLLGLALQLAAAAQVFTVEGTVKDPSGAAIPGAGVEAYGPTRRSATADEQGHYRLEGLAVGSYRFTAVAGSFGLKEWSAEVTAPLTGADTVLDLAPTASTVETASKVVEETLHVPFLVSSVSAKELRDTGAASFDEVLRSVAGLQHATQGNVFTRISTRGLRDTADVLTLIDGMPLRQLAGAADLTMIPVTALQAVEFVKGTASSIYGRNSIGGVMQFFTVPENGPKRAGDLVFTTASFDTREGQGSLHLPTRRGRVAGAGAVSRSEGFQQNTGRDSSFLTLAADHTFSRRFNLRLGYLVSDVDAGRGSIIPLRNGQPLYGITPRDNYGVPGARFSGLLNSYSGKVDSQITDRLFLTNSFNFNRYNRFFTGGITILATPTNRGYSESDTRQDTYLNDTLVQWDGGNAHFRDTLLGGATFEAGNMDQASPAFANPPTYSGPNFNTPLTNAANDPRGIRGAVTNSYFGQNIQSFYIQNRAAWSRASITLGLRTDRFDQQLTRSDTNVPAQFAASKVSPRIGGDVTVLRTESLTLVAFANFAQGFRPQFPALNTLNNVIVAQLLRPEVTRNTEGGLRVQHGIVSGQVSFFNMRKVDGQRSFRSGPDSFVFVNATTRVRGLEGEVRARLPRGVQWFGNYAYHNARNLEFRPTATTNFDGYRLRMSPHHITGSGVTLGWNRFAWTTSVSYVGSRPLRDNIVNPQVLPSYTLVDSSLSARLGPVQVVLSASNLADRYYIADDFSSQDAGCPGVPRRVALQIRYRF